MCYLKMCRDRCLDNFFYQTDINRATVRRKFTDTCIYFDNAILTAISGCPFNMTKINHTMNM